MACGSVVLIAATSVIAAWPLTHWYQTQVLSELGCVSNTPMLFAFDHGRSSLTVLAATSVIVSLATVRERIGLALSTGALLLETTGLAAYAAAASLPLWMVQL
jgi:hypothetical protein